MVNVRFFLNIYQCTSLELVKDNEWSISLENWGFGFGLAIHCELNLNEYIRSFLYSLSGLVVDAQKSLMAGDNVALGIVLDTLRQAASQNAEILKPAEKKLQDWEIERGFYPILLNIFSNHSIDVNVRWLAVLCLKTGVDRYWRKLAPNGIPDEEKEILRTGLVSNFHEPVNQLATQHAVVIAKVARYDFPREWPTLMPVLLSKVRDPNILVQQRGLLVLHHVIKTLSSKRLPGDRRFFQELSSEIYSFVLNLWNTHTEEFLQQVTNDSANALPSLEKSLLALRILRKSTVQGFKEPHNATDVVLFVNMVFERAKTMLECRKCMLDNANMIEILEKVIIQLSKVLLSLLEIHPLSYVDFIKPSLQFAVFYAFTPEGQPFLFERFVVQCLNLIKMILLCAEYKPLKGNDEAVGRAQNATISFFQPEILTAMFHKLVGNYFLLTPEDLQLWDSDPENFASDEGGESWKYNLKPCTESLFLTLYNEFRSTLSPVLVELINSCQEMVPPDDLNAILRKDAIYNAAGQAFYHFYDEVDFDQWFLSSLARELRVEWGHYRVLRRRISWLLGRWSGIKLSPNLRPQLHQVMLHLLRPEEDMVVRLAASKALLEVLDTADFNLEQFLEYLEPTVAALFGLLKECNECESKMYILHVMSYIVERVGPLIRPYIKPLSEYLPFVWEESADHEMLRCAILSTLVQIVKAMFSDCYLIESFVFPVLALSTDMQQKCSVYLLEDGLALWLAYVENSAAMSDNLINCYRNMPPLFEQTEHLEMCAAITQAYTLLAPENFLKVYGQEIVSKCEYLLTDLCEPGIVIIMGIYETFLRVSPELAVELLKEALPNVFLRICENETLPVVMWTYFTILARTLLLSKDTFVATLTAVGRKLSFSLDEVLSKILDICFASMSLPRGSHDRQSKLISLAIASLITVQSRPVLVRLPMVLRLITETLNDITKEDSTGRLVDAFVPESSSSPHCIESDDDEYEVGDFAPQTEHSERKLKLDLADVVHTVKLSSYLQSQLSELTNQVGARQMEEMLRTFDSETVCQLRNYGVL